MGLIVAAGWLDHPHTGRQRSRVGIGDGNNVGTWDTIVPSNYHGASGHGEMGESLLR